MLKKIIRWLVAMLALTLIALTLLLSPVLGSHAAAPQHSNNHATQSQNQHVTPDWFMRP